jgi:hypothetical protein
MSARRSDCALVLSLIAVLGMVAAGCESSKSKNPLSPEIAGPIPNVTITAPKLLEPSIGGEIEVDQQPIQLLLENAHSNSPRPHWYEVQVAADSGFQSIVHAVEGLQPGDAGRTAYRLPDALQAGRTYYWRARALDGANSGPFAPTAHFEVLVPVVIDPPRPVSPAANQVISTTQPELVVANGNVAGRAGEVVYRFEVSTTQTFSSLYVVYQTTRSSGSTTSVTTTPLPNDQGFFWRARGTNGKVTSSWSVTETFRTPPAPPPPPSGPGPTPPSGPGGLYYPPGTYRTPDPPPGGKLPLPDMYFVVQEIAHAHPAALANSCQHYGGTWEFMDRVVDRLRQYDLRWGYNWKRGVVGDPSLDVVDYHWSSGTSEGSINVYIIDIIVGHCGSHPSIGWMDVTDITYSSGTVGMWTGRGRF